MGFILWLVIGGVVGWLASLVMRTDAQQGILLNIIVGIAGAAIAGFLFGGGASVNQQISLVSVGLSVVGAVLLLAVVGLLRRAIR